MTSFFFLPYKGLHDLQDVFILVSEIF